MQDIVTFSIKKILLALRNFESQFMNLYIVANNVILVNLLCKKQLMTM